MWNAQNAAGFPIGEHTQQARWCLITNHKPQVAFIPEVSGMGKPNVSARLRPMKASSVVYA